MTDEKKTLEPHSPALVEGGHGLGRPALGTPNMDPRIEALLLGGV